MSTIPRDPALDSTLALLREGYAFISNRCRRLGSDAFETRLAGRPAVCMQGEEAARAFYDAPLTRRGGLPYPIFALLQDRGSVQSLDGGSHRSRKRLFLEALAPERAGELAGVVEREWRLAAERWQRAPEVVLLRAAEEVLCRAVCAWTGIPLSEAGARRRTDELAAMIDGAGTLGPRNWRGHLLRRRTEAWAAGIVGGVRRGAIAVPVDSPLQALAEQRDGDGALLGSDVAAVELLNVVRPTVAVARYVVFAALALHERPERRLALESGGAAELERFVQEVRRFYPFFPVVAGRVERAFDWRGYRLRPGQRVVLDLYGTNHDSRLWQDPDEFRPARFRDRQENAFAPIPQGGGDHLEGHRCAGEWVTIAVLETCVRELVQGLDYEVPPQDLRVRLSRMPAQPESGFVLRRVRSRAA